MMLKLMQGVTSLNLGEGYRRAGTAAALRYGDYQFKSEIAAKTGTTQNYSDGWFIGITPKIVGGAWVGCEDRSVHFNGSMGAGTSSALPIWGYFMLQVYNNSSLGITQQDVFNAPENMHIMLDCESQDENTSTSGFPEEEFD
jgi:penicillin-binding protein 1A